MTQKVFNKINCILFVIIYIGISGCNRINPKEITVINDIKLGSTLEEFYIQCDSLNIEKKSFYTKRILTNINDLDECKIRLYVTDIFNSSNYSTKYTQHLGLFCPIRFEGTKNIVGLAVLIVHTSPASLITKDRFEDLEEKPCVSQDIVSDQVDEIENLLSHKYGKPTDSFESDYLEFVIERNEIRSYRSDSLNNGVNLVWKTKYLDITLFKGIASPTNTFDLNNLSYNMHFKNNPHREINYDDGERPCYAYTYIKYVLNREAIKNLKLDNIKL